MPQSGTDSGLGPAAEGPGSPAYRRWACLLVLGVAVLIAYAPMLRAPLFFDDLPAIVDNPSIRHLGDLGSVLAPPSALGDDSGASGRPLVNLTFAANYALGGLDPWGYHALNLAIHLGCALLLFGIVRRTLLLRSGGGGGPEGETAAFAAALLWAVHPLLTESVSCAVQRTESLMGLCYLATIYCFIRNSETGAGRRGWAALAFGSCLLGMAAKEAMVTAPVLVLLYDRTFVSGSLIGAWKRHRRIHLALASTWFLLAVLVLRNGSSRGFGQGAGAWSYLLTQCRALVLYLKLSVWPHPLAIDYGTWLASGPSEVWPQAILLLALLLLACWCLVRRPAAGFLLASFFVVLSPSSSFVPLAKQTMAEHRMYLPLAALAVLAACALMKAPRALGLAVTLAVAAILGGMTWERNKAFLDPSALWVDAVRALPSNERAHNNLGFALSTKAGRLDDAVAQYREALRLKPDFFQAQTNLANALVRMPGHLDEAIELYEASLRTDPIQFEAHYNLACALQARGGADDEAIVHLEDAIRLRPDYAEAHANLGFALQSRPGRIAEAIAHYEESLRLKPGSAVVHLNLALAILKSGGSRREAEAHVREALRIDPGNESARRILAYLGY